MNQDHIHTPSDGRGNRRVFVDGAEVKQVTYADTITGVVTQIVNPVTVATGGEVMTRTLRGKVEVTFK